MNTQTNPPSTILNPTSLHGNVRRSKIGRLPTDVRNWLNQALNQGMPHQTISEQLAKMGHPGITVANISTWSYGGHVLWCRDQDAADQLREQANRLTDILDEMEGDTADKVAKLAEQIAAIQIAQVLQAIDPNSGKSLLQENQDLFFRLVRALTHQTRERTFNKKIELEQRKYNDQVAKARRAERKAQLEADEKEGRRAPTPEELEIIKGASNITDHPPKQLAKIVNKYRLLIYRIKREAEERARRNNWDNTDVSPDPYVAAIERGEDPFASVQPTSPVAAPAPQQPEEAQ